MCAALVIEKLKDNIASLENGLRSTEKLLLKKFCVRPNNATIGFDVSLP
jgi:hypothetical protein